ncbi:MAG: hypothetical protein ACK53Y_15215, partial [bacterium]
SHNSNEVIEFIEKCNKDTITTCIQVPDVAINKVFKSAVKNRYHQHRAKMPVSIGKKYQFQENNWLILC